MSEKDFIEKALQILENMQGELESYGKYRFSDETRRLISELAEYCRKTDFYNHIKKKEPEYFRKESAEYLYHHMIIKIAKAPSFFHSSEAVILMMPAIDDALKEGRTTYDI